MTKKTRRQEVLEALKVLKRWEVVANSRNKVKAKVEIARIYEILKWVEETSDFRTFE